MIELGVPYSDPLADGPVIQAAATRALENGATLDKVIAMAKKAIDNGKGVKAPIVMFTYFNPIYQRGVETFVRQIADAGAKGLLIPDVPLEETYETSKICAKYGIDLVLLSTPTTPTERARQIAQNTKGFVYLVSVTGVTGMQTNVASRVEELVADLRTVTDEPVAVGFGVSSAEHAKQIVKWGADGVIVGSALVRALGVIGLVRRARDRGGLGGGGGVPRVPQRAQVVVRHDRRRALLLLGVVEGLHARAAAGT